METPSDKRPSEHDEVIGRAQDDGASSPLGDDVRPDDSGLRPDQQREGIEPAEGGAGPIGQA